MAPAARQWEKLGSTWDARLVDIGKEEASRTATAAAEDLIEKEKAGSGCRRKADWR